jgi:hypothetical protein
LQYAVSRAAVLLRDALATIANRDLELHARRPSFFPEGLANDCLKLYLSRTHARHCLE